MIRYLNPFSYEKLLNNFRDFRNLLSRTEFLGIIHTLIRVKIVQLDRNASKNIYLLVKMCEMLYIFYEND